MREFIKGRFPDTAHFWSLYIDIEGFSYLYKERSMKPMSDMTSDVFALLDSGRDEFSGLSAIQYGGDGFLIKQVGRVYDHDLRRPLAIGCALMKRALVDRFTLRAQLSVGDSADVSGTYSTDMQQRIRARGNSGILGFNRGARVSTMLYNPLIGTAIFNAYRLQRPKGPLFVVDSCLALDLQKDDIRGDQVAEGVLIDWIRYDHEYVRSGMEILEIDDKFDYRDGLARYLVEHAASLSDDWKSSVEQLLSL